MTIQIVILIGFISFLETHDYSLANMYGYIQQDPHCNIPFSKSG